VLVDTGTLRGSIRKMKVSETEFLVTAGGEDVNPKTGKPCNYAAIIEARFPYMKPAVDLIKPMIAPEMEMEVMKNL